MSRAVRSGPGLAPEARGASGRDPLAVRVGFGCAAALLLTLACLGCHRPSGGSEGVLAADRARIDAMVSADPVRLEDALHGSLTYTHSSGGVDSKASLIQKLVSGRVRYRSIEPDALRIRMRGGTAVITGRARMVVEAEGRTHALTLAHTAVYWWERGRWRLAAYHSSPLE